MLAPRRWRAVVASLREDYLSQVQRVFLSHAHAQHPQRNVGRRERQANEMGR